MPHLDGEFTVFGKLIDGFETLTKMEGAPVNAKNKPETDIKIEKVVVHANPIADEEAAHQ